MDPKRFGPNDIRSIKAAGSGGAGAHWREERVTAALFGPMFLWLWIRLLRCRSFDRPSLIKWMGKPHVAVFTALTLALGFRHMQLGMSVIATDYARGARRRSLLRLIRAVSFLLYAVTALSLGKIVVERIMETRK